MKTLRILSAALALSIAFASGTGHAADTSVANLTAVADVHVQQTPAQLTDRLNQIIADVKAAPTANPAMLARIDSLVSDIDFAIQSKSANTEELSGLRQKALKLRSIVSKTLAGEIENGTQLVNQIVQEFPAGTASSTPSLDGSMGGNSGTSMPASSGVSGGGGGGAAGGMGGLGGLAALGAVGAVAATTNDDDEPGVPASPSR
ncbi:hypothetical protein K227x_42990 [Rubripirellula lacrimiformis]|uniref:Uncharacterized protein n=1 Tax=Rubripirellula lacrimiformis TaxID=1930273 RepID=A0A517NFI3_9BACT|nr:hypothetical protein [Rubripirellula lacrimiformis]QDT05894.1 hypothetical protein K227x_42990 [Rubripirellula lacrimiformis]